MTKTNPKRRESILWSGHRSGVQSQFSEAPWCARLDPIEHGHHSGEVSGSTHKACDKPCSKSAVTSPGE